jgi:hypothetical protein
MGTGKKLIGNSKTVDALEGFAVVIARLLLPTAAKVERGSDPTPPFPTTPLLVRLNTSI